MRTLIFALLLSAGPIAKAEEWGVTLGAGNYGFRTGLITSVFFRDDLKLRSGVIYSHRRFDLDFVDWPLLLQWNITPVVGFYLGPQIALHTYANTIYQGGINLLFDNMWGLDAYYEQSAGRFEDGAPLTSVGAAIVYYFL